MCTPPDIGKSASARIDEQLHQDLTTLMRAGLNVSEAIRHCINVVAGAVDAAWVQGHYPPGVMPTIVSAQLAPYTPDDARPTPVGQQA